MQPASAPGHAATIAALARPLDLRGLNLTALHLVMAIRLCALFERAQREPLAELAQRFRSFEAAEAVLDLIRVLAGSWPEPFVANRPCCLALSPDETTVAAMARHALAADRPAFSAELEGFVRADRHERLYAGTVRAGAMLQAAARAAGA